MFAFSIQRTTAKSFQVTNQISLEGSYKNRYDVTLLVNGLPLVQIELKRASKSKKPSTKSIATRTILFGARSVSIRAIVCDQQWSQY
jgi:type I site-specific restriction-modification system R (restriction) subunit